VTARYVTSAFFALSAAVGLSGCGSEAAPSQAAGASAFPDDMFEGIFISKSFECVKGNAKTPIAGISDLRRTMLIVNDQLLVTDANRIGRNSEMIDVVSRYYAVGKRSIVDPNTIRLDLVAPSAGSRVYRNANSVDSRPLADEEIHPVSSALKNESAGTWTYSFKNFLLHVSTENTPGNVCPDGGQLHIVFENRKSK